MALIQWNDTLSVGITEIDRQHQRLIEMINELNTAMQQGKGKDVMSKIIRGLIDYAVTHFKTEEKYFEQYGYPDAVNHKKAHAEFNWKIAEFNRQLNAGQLGLSIQVMDFLSDWLRDHIKTVDKKYAPFLIQKGLK
jgi:hemerythrin